MENEYFFQGQKYTSFGKNILHRQSASLGHSATGHSEIVILGICVLQSQLLFIQYFVKTITVIGEHKCRVLQYVENFRET